MSFRSDTAREQRIREARIRSAIWKRFASWLRGPKIDSDGGYAKVSDADFGELADLIHVLVKARWGEDEDGDLPVEVTLVNRTTHKRLLFVPVPYGWSGHDDGIPSDSPEAFLLDAKEHLARQVNLSIAQGNTSSMVDRLIRRAMQVAEATIAKRDHHDRPALRGRKDPE